MPAPLAERSDLLLKRVHMQLCPHRCACRQDVVAQEKDVVCSSRGHETSGIAVVWTLQQVLCCAQVQVADQRGADLLVLSADAVHDKSVDANLLAVSSTHCKVPGPLDHNGVRVEALTKSGSIVVAAYHTRRATHYHKLCSNSLHAALFSLQEFVPCPMLVLP